MALQTAAGAGVLDKQIEEVGLPITIDGADGDVTLRINQTMIRVVNTDSSDAVITLPPVGSCAGSMFVVYKSDSSSQSVFVKPAGYITSSTTGGDSLNWQGGEGYDIDAQHDQLVLLSTGISWMALIDGTAIA